MPNSIKAVIISAIVILVGLGAWWFVTAQPAQPAKETSTNTSQSSQTSAPTTEPSEQGITIVFTDNGFEKQSYTVAAGQSITVKNNSSIEVEFSSDDHPTHTLNPELNMGILQPGEQNTITPDKAGTWGIHDHEHPEFTTTVTVTN